MKSLITITTCCVSLVSSAFAAETTEKMSKEVSSPAKKECKACDVPSRAALLAGGAAKVSDAKEKCDVECEDKAVHFVVAGMKCGGCSAKLKNALVATEGVTVDKVCHSSGCAVVKLDGAKTDKASVQKAIEKTGLKVAGERVTIPVLGMKCAGCSSNLEELVETVEGCSDAEACHKSKSLVATVDSSKTSQKALEEKIASKGFKIGK